jgi:hypothetical protein
MKIKFNFLALISIIAASQLFAWGIWGHKHINKAAVFALPPEMRAFFFNHADYLTEESVVPDVRKYSLNDKAEGPRHYIDIENYNTPIDSLPLTLKEALTKYDSATLMKNGSLPWHIQFMMEKLTQAFKERNSAAILFLAGELGHYIGDAHMPLHTSNNHDGQLTNQKGIHAFWEAQLPEMFGEAYNLNTDDAKMIEDIPAYTWQIIKSSHQLADTMLMIEKNTSSGLPENQVFEKDETGKTKKTRFYQLIHTKQYAQKYHDALHGMVESQMRKAVAALADYWYTAWVKAGKPDLTSLDDDNFTRQNKKNYAKEMAAWKKGKLLNLKIENEF